MLQALKAEMASLADPDKARILSRFFKTGKGQYGEGDLFLGIPVPLQRKVAKKYSALEVRHIRELLSSAVHEHRLTALLILIHRFRNADANGRNSIARFYLTHRKFVNNWDLVDLSAPHLLGAHLAETRERGVLYRLAASANVWDRRISIVAAFAFIRNNDFRDALEISEVLVRDRHDLIQKAVGWMLREIGKRDEGAERIFLDRYHRVMPRTMLRYAIERLARPLKNHYLSKEPE